MGVSTGFGSGARVLHAVPLDVVVGSCGSTLLLKEGMERLSVLGRVTPTEVEAVDAEGEDTIILAQRSLSSSHTEVSSPSCRNSLILPERLGRDMDTAEHPSPILFNKPASVTTGKKLVSNASNFSLAFLIPILSASGTFPPAAFLAASSISLLCFGSDSILSSRSLYLVFLVSVMYFGFIPGLELAVPVVGRFRV